MASKNILKKLEREVSSGYKKSGLRDIYEKNKSSILSAAAIAGAAGTGGLIAPMLGKGLAAGILTGGAAGGLGALAKTGADKKEKKQRELQSQAKAEQDARNLELDKFLGDVSGPNKPSDRPRSQPIINPAEVPGSVDPLPQILPEDVQQTGGVVLRGDEASNDVAKLMAEAELQKKMQTDYAGGNKAERAKMLQEYADLITKQQQRVFGEQMPGLYEDLNTRGLLRSSELGNAVSREQAKAAQILAEQVGLQGLQDREAALNEGSGIQNQYYQGRYGAIQRGMSLEDFVRQTKAAQLTGLALQPQRPSNPSTKAGTAQAAIGGAGVGAKFGAPGAIVGALGGGILGSDPSVKGA